MKLIQEQLRQLESRNEELETKFADVTRANLELQVAERELRDQIVTCVSREEIQKMEKKMEVEKRRWDSNTVDTFEKATITTLVYTNYQLRRAWRSRKMF